MANPILVGVGAAVALDLVKAGYNKLKDKKAEVENSVNPKSEVLTVVINGKAYSPNYLNKSAKDYALIEDDDFEIIIKRKKK